MIDEFPPFRRDAPLVTWRFACTDAQLAEWQRSPGQLAVAVDYHLSDAPVDAWWRVEVVTQSWLHGLLARSYTARPHPAMLIVPDGELADRRTAITRLLDPDSALDLSRVAERVPLPPSTRPGPAQVGDARA